MIYISHIFPLLNRRISTKSCFPSPDRMVSAILLLFAPERRPDRGHYCRRLCNASLGSLFFSTKRFAACLFHTKLCADKRSGAILISSNTRTNVRNGPDTVRATTAQSRKEIQLRVENNRVKRVSRCLETVLQIHSREPSAVIVFIRRE